MDTHDNPFTLFSIIIESIFVNICWHLSTNLTAFSSICNHLPAFVSKFTIICQLGGGAAARGRHRRRRGGAGASGGPTSGDILLLWMGLKKIRWRIFHIFFELCRKSVKTIHIFLQISKNRHVKNYFWYHLSPHNKYFYIMW